MVDDTDDAEVIGGCEVSADRWSVCVWSKGRAYQRADCDRCRLQQDARVGSPAKQVRLFYSLTRAQENWSDLQLALCEEQLTVSH